MPRPLSLLLLSAVCLAQAAAAAPPAVRHVPSDPLAADGAGAGNGYRKEDAEGLSLEAERRLQLTVDAATWLSLDVSPDGERLVLEILGDLYLLPVAGGEAERLTEGMAFDSQPRLSPDGPTLVFVSDRSGSENLWLLDLEDREPRQLSQENGKVEFASPSWSPEGDHVVASRTFWGLNVFELWAYHRDGGKGVRITQAKSNGSTPTAQRHNALGAVYDPSGRYLYYARRNGGFTYNAEFPLWQVAHRDLLNDAEDVLTQARGSAIRPQLSPDGRHLVYGTRFEHRTGLRIRDLDSGEDRWLVYPVQFDEQESRFTRDLLPGYAFTPDGEAVIYTAEGGIRRVDVASGAVTAIPFTAQVDQGLGPRLYFPYRLGVGPVKARLVRDIVLSPDGRQAAFSAFTRVYLLDLASGELRPVSPEGLQAFHPSFSPDGRELAYVSWSSRGGHIWRQRARAGARAVQLTGPAALYSDPFWSPDGRRLVALRGSAYERLYQEWDSGETVGADLVWLPAAGGAARTVMPARGATRPHFGADAERIYLYQSGTGLISVRYDGTDRRRHLAVKGPGIFYAEEPVAADDVRIAPDGRHALIAHANQLYLTTVVNPYLLDVEMDLDNPSLPTRRLTDVGADFFGWDADGGGFYWTVGHELYQRPLASVDFRDEDDAAGENAAVNDPAAPGTDAGVADAGVADSPEVSEADADEPQPLAEEHEAVRHQAIEVYLPRAVPAGTLALTGATVLPMTAATAADAVPMADAVVLIEGDRIAAVGPAAAVAIPDGADVIDLTGQYLLPGYVDTHAHYRPLRRVLDRENWAFLANLAYGVTTGLDVQPSTVDILAYQDLIDAGLMIGPRALSTGPGLFSNNDFRSAEHAEAVLRRYKDHYRVHNLKAYVAGNRQQRQWIVAAARELELMPTTEGALDSKLDLSHAIDGFSGNEHNLPTLALHEDVVALFAESGIAYTPTLLVNYGGPAAENWFYTRESPLRDPKLRRFTPPNMLAARALRTFWVHEDEYVFDEFAAQAAKIVRAGGRVGIGSHGQLQGLGFHWELRAVASGGLSNWEALRAATRHGAEIIGVAEDIGTVEAGKLADLVVLEGNPLEDLRATEALRYVIKNGEVFEARALHKIWPEAEALPAQWWWNTAPTAATDPTAAEAAP